MLPRWKRAVVHLEGASDNHTFVESVKMSEDHLAKRITDDQYMEFMKGSRANRYQGTALYVRDGESCFLVTARHVLVDEKSSEENRARLGSRKIPDDFMFAPNHQLEDTIFSIIFRVPSFDEFKKDTPVHLIPSMMNLGAGSPISQLYTFSNPEIDIAVISLSRRNSMFKSNLDSLGFEPIDISEINEEDLQEGSEIFTVGYPYGISDIGYRDQPKALAHWSSSYYSLPVFSFGKIAMFHKDIDYFWADISIYAGNSGGPIVCNGKLIGIVTANAVIPLVNDTNFSMRIPFAKLTKSKHIVKLIQYQKEKDMKVNTMWSV